MEEELGYFSLEFFPGGVPTGEYFSLMLRELKSLLRENREKKSFQDLCFLGATSYFEAFFKDVFAASLNIVPQMLDKMKSSHYDVTVDPLIALEMGRDISRILGFLISDKHDFGTAEKVNKLYFAAIGITPFGSKDKEYYDKINSIRNLIVHHGGTYNTKYRPEKFDKEITAKHGLFYHSVVISHEDNEKLIEFMASVAQRTVVATRKAVEKYVEKSGVYLDEDRENALNFLGMWSMDEEYYDVCDCSNEEED